MTANKILVNVQYEIGSSVFGAIMNNKLNVLSDDHIIINNAYIFSLQNSGKRASNPRIKKKYLCIIKLYKKFIKRNNYFTGAI